MSPVVPTLKCINLAAPSICGMSIVAYSAKFLIDDIFPRIMARPHCVQTPARVMSFSFFNFDRTRDTRRICSKFLCFIMVPRQIPAVALLPLALCMLECRSI